MKSQMDKTPHVSYLSISCIFVLSLNVHPSPKSGHPLTPVPVSTEAVVFVKYQEISLWGNIKGYHHLGLIY